MFFAVIILVVLGLLLLIAGSRTQGIHLLCWAGVCLAGGTPIGVLGIVFALGVLGALLSLVLP